MASYAPPLGIFNEEEPMQIQMQAICRDTKSMRQAITNDLEENGHGLLKVRQKKNMKRANGWAKITARRSGITGSLNIEWDSKQRMLVARAVGKNASPPYLLLGVFLDYLMESHADSINTINVQLR